MKKNIALFVILSLAALSDAAAEETANKKVVINGTQLTAKDIQALERSYGVPMQTGRYWYDCPELDDCALPFGFGDENGRLTGALTPKII